MPLPLDLWYSQGKHAAPSINLTRDGRRWCSCVIPFKLMDGWGCLYRTASFMMGTQGYQTKDTGQPDLCPTDFWPSRPHPVALPGNSENVKKERKLDPSLSFPVGLLLLNPLGLKLGCLRVTWVIFKIPVPRSPRKSLIEIGLGWGPNIWFWKNSHVIPVCNQEWEPLFHITVLHRGKEKALLRPLMPLFPSSQIQE